MPKPTPAPTEPDSAPSGLEGLVGLGKKLSAARKPAVNAFIVFHIVALTIWMWPPGGLLRNKLADVVAPYMRYSGLWQGWGMFSPNPLSLNFRVTADITYADGAKRSWEFYRLGTLHPLERHTKERHRKWVENVRQDQFKVAWDDAATWVARQHHDTPANPPTMVVLKRHWSQIPPPEVGLRKPPPAPESQYAFYTRVIKPEDLR